MTPKPQHPDTIKTPPTSIGIYEGEGDARKHQSCPACGGRGYVLCDDYECHPGCRNAKCRACA